MSSESAHLSSSNKLSLPAFLKVLTTNNVPMPKAMAAAGKLYKTYNTPESLGRLTDLKLVSEGIAEKEDRKLILAAIRKAGYKCTGGKKVDVIAGPSTRTPAKQSSSPKKRKRDDDLNEFLPEEPPDETAAFGSLEFNEIMDEEVLISKSTVVNRAPIMTAWATVVAERLGFQREEALSIASVYTEMNAISKGVSLGIFHQEKGKGVELQEGASQPYVDIMGRRIALYQTRSSGWRALLKGTPTPPGNAFSYIKSALRQTAPYILGAMMLLARAFSDPAELNRKGWSLYAEFRPQAEGWGKRGDVRCETILALRKLAPPIRERSSLVIGDSGAAEGQDSLTETALSSEDPSQSGVKEQQGDREAIQYRALSFEEYEALQDDTSLDGLDFGDVDGI